MPPTHRLLLLATLIGGPAMPAEERAPEREWSIGIGFGAKADGPNALTNGLVYFPGSLRVARDLASPELPFFEMVRAHASVGYGAIWGDETEGSTFEIMVGPEAGFCRSAVCVAVRLDLGYFASSYHWKERTADVRGVVLEPILSLRFPGRTQFGFGLEFGGRFKWPTFEQRLVAVDRAIAKSSQQGLSLGLLLDLRL